MKKNSLVFILILILISCDKKEDTNGYAINGVAKNVPDSTWVTMFLDINTVLDSTMIIDEKFQFTGKVDRPKRVALSIKSTRDITTLWLENTKIEITGEKGNMRNSKILGSKTQDEANLLVARKDSISNEIRELGKLITESNRDSLFNVHEKMLDVVADIDKGFIIDYPNSYQSLTVLHQFAMKRLGAKQTDALFKILSKELQLTEEGKSIAEFIKLNKNPKIGDKFVDFEQHNTKGKLIKFSELMGKYTLLEFWSSSCGPCRASNPELVKEYQLYKSKGFQIVGVSLDSKKERWLKAIEKDGLPWENLSDLNGIDNKAALIYGVEALPDNFLIDENGIIVARYLRDDNLKRKLKELFTN